MKRSFILTLCLLITATSHSVQAQPKSKGLLSLLVGDLQHDLSAMAQKGLPWFNSMKEDYGSIAAEAVEKTKQIVPEKISGALQSTVNKAHEINYANLFKEIKTWIVEHSYRTILITISVSEKMSKALQSSFNKAYEINYANLLNEIKTWIMEHPYRTIFRIANGIVFFYPSLITGPVFWSLGWTSTGPRAGSAAGALMGKFGVVPRRGTYAHLQSSAMGGYGSALVQGATRAGSVVLEVSQWPNSYLHGPETSKADNTAGLERPKGGRSGSRRAC